MKKELITAMVLISLLFGLERQVSGGPVIENEYWRLEFDQANGAIISLEAANGEKGATRAWYGLLKQVDELERHPKSG